MKTSGKNNMFAVFKDDNSDGEVEQKKDKQPKKTTVQKDTSEPTNSGSIFSKEKKSKKQKKKKANQAEKTQPQNKTSTQTEDEKDIVNITNDVALEEVEEIVQEIEKVVDDALKIDIEKKLEAIDVADQEKQNEQIVETQPEVADLNEEPPKNEKKGSLQEDLTATDYQGKSLLNNLKQDMNGMYSNQNTAAQEEGQKNVKFVPEPEDYKKAKLNKALSINDKFMHTGVTKDVRGYSGNQFNTTGNQFNTSGNQFNTTSNQYNTANPYNPDLKKEEKWQNEKQDFFEHLKYLLYEDSMFTFKELSWIRRVLCKYCNIEPPMNFKGKSVALYFKKDQVYEGSLGVKVECIDSLDEDIYFTGFVKGNGPKKELFYGRLYTNSHYEVTLYQGPFKEHGKVSGKNIKIYSPNGELVHEGDN